MRRVERRPGISIIEVIVFVVIVALLTSIMIPTVGRARKLARQLAAKATEESAEAPAETEEMAKAREAAQKMAEDLGIDDSVVAVTEAAGLSAVGAIVLVDHPEGLDAPPDARRRAVNVLHSAETDGAAVISVLIDGAVVYTSVGGDVRKYLGAGEWEGALDRALWQVRVAKQEEARREREARESRFKRLREEKYGPLPFLAKEHTDAADTD